MLSSQTATNKLSNYFEVRQSIGQICSNGNFQTEKTIFFYGFQHPQIYNIEEKSTLNPLIFPNPFKNFLFITTNINDYVVIEIFDLRGRKVYNNIQIAQDEILKINLEHLETSPYVIKMSINNEIYSSLILKDL